MCYPVCGVLLIEKSSPGGGGSGFSLTEWSFIIGPTPFNQKQSVLSASLNKYIYILYIFIIIPSFLHSTTDQCSPVGVAHFCHTSIKELFKHVLGTTSDLSKEFCPRLENALQSANMVFIATIC